jgi:Tfp pilus assembly protein FimV
LRRGSSSEKTAGRAKAAEAKAANKRAAKAKAAEEKTAKRKRSEVIASDEPLVEPVRSEAPRGVLVRRPKTSIYSVLLGVTAGALVIGCLVLVLEIWTYGAPWTFPWNIPINFR